MFLNITICQRLNKNVASRHNSNLVFVWGYNAGMELIDVNWMKTTLRTNINGN